MAVGPPTSWIYPLKSGSHVIFSDSFIIELSFIVLVAVNEIYEIKLETGWGTKGIMLNPSEFEESKVFQASFSFHKRPGKDIKEIIISVDGSQLFSETIDKSVKTTASSHLPIVCDSYSTKIKVLSSIIQGLASTFNETIRSIETTKEIESNESKIDIVDKDSHRIVPSSTKYSWQTPSFYAIVEKDEEERRAREEIRKKRKG